MFLAKHPNDEKKTDEFSRWWPDWYRYTTNNQGQVVYGDRILIRPSVTPSSSEKFVQRATDLPIVEATDHVLLRPFDFELLSEYNRTLQKIHILQWTKLIEICLDIGMLPPTIGPNFLQKPNAEKFQRVHRKRKSPK